MKCVYTVYNLKLHMTLSLLVMISQYIPIHIPLCLIQSLLSLQDIAIYPHQSRYGRFRKGVPQKNSFDWVFP